MLHGEGVHAGVFVDAGVAFAGVDGACEVGRQFADEAVVGEAEVAELEGEAEEGGEEGGGEGAAVDEDGAVEVGVGEDGEGGGLMGVSGVVWGWEGKERTSRETSWSSMLPTYVTRTPKRRTSSRAARYIWLTRLLGSPKLKSSDAIGPKYFVLYSENGPILMPAIAQIPMRAELTHPNWISFATSMTATGTPWEWHATRMKSAWRMMSTLLRRSAQRVFTRSAMKPSPSRATCWMLGS